MSARHELAEYEKLGRFGFDLTSQHDFWLFLCTRCGSVVNDCERHTEWHYEMSVDWAGIAVASGRTP